LLILGEQPGSGKTTLLLELARDLLERAKADKEDRIPVVLMLSSWSIKQLPLEQWIAEELKTEYHIPLEFGRAWAQAHRLLLLLDGLDEVAPNALPACIEALNTYARQAQKAMVVCCRTGEYLDKGQPARLCLHTAVSVQPLSFQQVEKYLFELGKDVSGLKNALEQEQGETLRTLATTPLFLKILILTYHGKSAEELLPLIEVASAEDQQHVLFHAYVERVLRKEGPRLHATAQQTKHWLGWLASQMTKHQPSEFYLEQLQPGWLPTRQRAFYRLSVGLIGWLIGGLIFGLSVGLQDGLIILMIAWMIYWLIGALFGRLSVGLIGGLTAGALQPHFFSTRGRQERRMCSSI
jgi:DNA polymerase III delta prime subunit